MVIGSIWPMDSDPHSNVDEEKHSKRGGMVPPILWIVLGGLSTVAALSLSNNNQVQPQNKGSFRRRRLVFIMLMCFLSWAGVTLWNQAGKLSERNDKVSALEQKLAEVQEANTDTQNEITRLNDPEYVEQKIRKELHYVKQGETLFYTPKQQKKQ